MVFCGIGVVRDWIGIIFCKGVRCSYVINVFWSWIRTKGKVWCCSFFWSYHTTLTPRSFHNIKNILRFYYLVFVLYIVNCVGYFNTFWRNYIILWNKDHIAVLRQRVCFLWNKDHIVVLRQRVCFIGGSLWVLIIKCWEESCFKGGEVIVEHMVLLIGYLYLCPGILWWVGRGSLLHGKIHSLIYLMYYSLVLHTENKRIEQCGIYIIYLPAQRTKGWSIAGLWIIGP